MSLILREARCQTNDQAEYFETARPIFSEAKSIKAFSLPQPIYAGGADFTLESLSSIGSPREISENFKAFLKAKLIDKSSYLFGVRKATRFYADRGLLFETPDKRSSLLISTEFQGGRLVLARRLDPRVFIVNLDPIFPSLLTLLTQALQ